MLEEVGYVGTLIARETPEGLQLIDGHLRAQILDDEVVDVMVVDLTDEEVDLILATHDVVSQMADTDVAKLDDLLRDLTTGSGDIAQMLSDYVDSIGGLRGIGEEEIEPAAHTEANPEYPLAPVFNEKYEYAVIFCTNETDWGALQTILRMEKEKSYKNTGVAIGRVIPFQRFLALYREWNDASEGRLPEPSSAETT